MKQVSIEAPIYLQVPAGPPPKPHTEERLFHSHWYGNTLLVCEYSHYMLGQALEMYIILLPP